MNTKQAKDIKAGDRVFLKSCNSKNRSIVSRHPAVVDAVSFGRNDVTVSVHEIGMKTILTFSVSRSHKIEIF